MTAGHTHLELWLVRHGETPASRYRVLAGWSNVPLTEEGERQAAALRPRLAGQPFTSVWCSDLDRAIHTARLAWGEARPDARLREIRFGDLEGRAWDELEQQQRDAITRFAGLDPPGGESFASLRTRVLAFVDGLGPGRHLLFTHGGVVRLLSREVGEDSFVPTGTLLVVDWSARRLVARSDGGGGGSGWQSPSGAEEER